MYLPTVSLQVVQVLKRHRWIHLDDVAVDCSEQVPIVAEAALMAAVDGEFTAWVNIIQSEDHEAQLVRETDHCVQTCTDVNTVLQCTVHMFRTSLSKIYLSIILPLTSSKCSLYLSFTSHSSVITCSVHLIINFITLISLWSSSVCSFLLPHVTTSLLGPNYFSARCCQILSVYSYPQKVTDKPTAVYVLIFSILGIKWSDQYFEPNDSKHFLSVLVTVKV